MKGWIKSIRQSKRIMFISITDGQMDHQLTLIDGSHELIGELKVGSSFIAEGTPSKTPRGLDEFVVSKLTVIGKSDDEYPIQPKHHTPDFLRTIPHLRGRTKGTQAVWKIRHHLTQAIHKFMESEEFMQYYTPLITTADCEGAGETFKVKSEWLEESLTVSGQLQLEVGMMSLGKVYTHSPCFRAEKSSTKKHLSEFWMTEVEVMFMELDETIDFSERLVKSCITYILEKCEYELKQLDITTEHLDILKSDWIRKEYSDICEEFGIEFGDDVSSEKEKEVIEKYKLPVYITHYPKDLKPFYMKKDEKTALCFDLIFPEVGELIGGSQREDDYDTLKEEMIKSGLDLEKMQWYLDTRKWGSVPHSGFGIGFERLLMFITKTSKIHDVIPFPVSY